MKEELRRDRERERERERRGGEGGSPVYC